MMKMALHEVVDMITVRHGLVPATGTMDVPRLMAGAAVLRGAGVRVRPRHVDHVLVDMIAVWMVQMAVMQIIDMIVVSYGGVAASRAMQVRMVGVMGLRTLAHFSISSIKAL
jgi:hypothetical protein